MLNDNYLTSLAVKDGEAIPGTKDPVDSPALHQLEHLSLSGNRLATWESSVDQLGRVASRVFPALRSLSFVGNPISTHNPDVHDVTTFDQAKGDTMDAEVERQRLMQARQEVHTRLLVIARLPFLAELEGTPVRQPERTDAERYWLGRLKDGTEPATDLSQWAEARVAELYESKQRRRIRHHVPTLCELPLELFADELPISPSGSDPCLRNLYGTIPRCGASSDHQVPFVA